MSDDLKGTQAMDDLDRLTQRYDNQFPAPSRLAVADLILAPFLGLFDAHEGMKDMIISQSLLYTPWGHEVSSACLRQAIEEKRKTCHENL